ncbi:hypothetical protein GCM10027018_02320 [Paenibacillus thermoaerophilus]
MVKGRRRNKERTIKIIIVNGNISILQQRAEGGGQILKNVGNNANQGGQTAVKGHGQPILNPSSPTATAEAASRENGTTNPSR